jgi:ribosomal protein S4E
MNTVAGPNLQSPIKRISAGGISEKENATLGITRLRTLLKRKVKKAENKTNSTTKKKTHVPKTDVWVNLQDGTKIKLCSTCAIKKKNVVSDALKDKSKLIKTEKGK